MSATSASSNIRLQLSEVFQYKGLSNYKSTLTSKVTKLGHTLTLENSKVVNSYLHHIESDRNSFCTLVALSALCGVGAYFSSSPTDTISCLRAIFLIGATYCGGSAVVIFDKIKANLENLNSLPFMFKQTCSIL